jgi:uncharacterized protein
MTRLDRHVAWQAWDGVSLETCRVIADAVGIRVESVALGIEDDTPWAVRYTLRCDEGWHARHLSVVSLVGEVDPITLEGDGAGHWRTPDGRPLPALEGCVDVDLTSTAFTNTLPIRRLEPRPGSSAEIVTVYVTVPGLTLSTSRQRYHCLERSPHGGRYRFEALDTGFTADIGVDGDGLVLDYPQIARRVWSR